MIEFKVGKRMWHKTLGHCTLIAQTKQDTELLWGIRVSPREVKFDTAKNFQLSCLNFEIGQAIKYNGGSFIVTALEEANNRVVVKTFTTTGGSQRYALIPDKCKVEKAQQLRVVVVNEHNEIVKEMHTYGK